MIKSGAEFLIGPMHHNASTYITPKITYRQSDGSEQTLETGFTRYSVVFTGEKLPNGRKADAVYIILNDIYMQVNNGAMTRFFTAADNLTDPRKAVWQKALNLLTGVRVTDVDVEKQRDVETRAALEAMMAGHPDISRYSELYVKPEDQAKLTPDEIFIMRKYTEL
jgi:hypothetical protein